MINYRLSEGLSKESFAWTADTREVVGVHSQYDLTTWPLHSKDQRTMPFVGMTPESAQLDQSARFESRPFELSIQSCDKNRERSQEKRLRSGSPKPFDVNVSHADIKSAMTVKPIREVAKNQAMNVIERIRAKSRSKSNSRVHFDPNPQILQPVVRLP